MTRSKHLKQFSRYSIVGLANNAFLYGLFLVLIYASIDAVMASVIVYVIGVLISYALNKYWSFESRSSHKHDAPRFVLAYGIGLLATYAFMTVFLLWMPAEIAQILTIVGTACVIYASLHFTRFGNESKNS